jgi:SPP1 gp7 family putative phage head morphogenesis protein
VAHPPSTSQQNQAQAQALIAQQNASNRAVLASIAGLLLVIGFGSAVSLAGDIAAMLLKLIPAPSKRAIDAVIQLVRDGIPNPNLGFEPGPAFKAEARNAAGWRALYIVAAVDRLTDAVDFGDWDRALVAEERYFEQHLEAEDNRLRVAQLVDLTAEVMQHRMTPLTEGLLGWRSVMDSRTTKECAFCNGKNFRADQMPMWGYPGSTHPRCRCSIVPAIPGAPLIPSA